MTIASGPVGAAIEILSIEPITRDELPRLRAQREPSNYTVKRLRQSHHIVARLLAMGLERATVAHMTGYTPERISQLQRSPAMQEQIAIYAKETGERLADGFDMFADLAIRNMTAAERQLSDHLAEADEADELLPMRELRAIVADRADRFGYGKHTTQTNVNVDFASKLEAAYARSRNVRPTAPPAALLGPHHDTSQGAMPRGAPTPIRRIA